MYCCDYQSVFWNILCKNLWHIQEIQPLENRCNNVVVSGLLFLFPFSSPGVTRYQSGDISKRTKALIVLSKTLIVLTLMAPFSVLFLAGFRAIGDSGLMLVLMSSFFSFIPLKLLSGKAVFDYRKDVSLLALALTGILFFSCTFNVLPVPTYLVLGIVSAVMAAYALKWLKQSP